MRTGWQVSFVILRNGSVAYIASHKAGSFSNLQPKAAMSSTAGSFPSVVRRRRIVAVLVLLFVAVRIG
jgi:hypothetical protein